MEGGDAEGMELESLIAKAKQHADVAANCLEWAMEIPDAAPGLVRAAGYHGRRLAALAEEMARRSGSRRASARGRTAGEAPRLPEDAERCALLDELCNREREGAGKLPPARRRQGFGGLNS